MGAWAFSGLTVAVLTKTLTFQAAFAAFTNEVIWLIVCSFFFAKGFEKTVRTTHNNTQAKGGISLFNFQSPASFFSREGGIYRSHTTTEMRS